MPTDPGVTRSTRGRHRSGVTGGRVVFGSSDAAIKTAGGDVFLVFLHPNPPPNWYRP